MPQHWVNVFIGGILIVAVLIDIWVRQANIFGTLWREFRPQAEAQNRKPPMPDVSSSTPPIVEMRHINKSFGAVTRAHRRQPRRSIRARSSASSATTRPASRR